MAIYAITFTIDYDTAVNWNRRYDSFMGEVRKCSTVWTETTSFCLVETTESLETLERRLFLSLFDPVKDKMLVINVSYDSAIARGAIQHPAVLRALLPGIELK